MEIVLDMKYKKKCDPDLKKYFLSFSMHMIYIVTGGAHDRHSGCGVRPRRGFY